MAYYNGTAGNHIGLFNAMRTNLLANSWTADRDITDDELIVHGPGSGTDAIYIGIKVYTDDVNNNYALYLNAYTGYNSATTFFNQPGAACPDTTHRLAIPLLKSSPNDNTALKYWMSINGRRLVVVAKIGVTYQHMYLGWFLPYAVTGEYPYPIMAGGSTVFRNNGGNAGQPYKSSDSASLVSAYWKPIDLSSNFGEITGLNTTLTIREPNGYWNKLYNKLAGNFNMSSEGTWPYISALENTQGNVSNLRPNIDGGYSLQPIMMFDSSSKMFYGELDGLRHVSGYNLNSESTITISSDTWIVFQNCSNTSQGDFIALKEA